MIDRERWQILVPETSARGPWPLLVELASLLATGSWTLIGGMMVQLHALRASVPHERATDDVDVLLHIETGATTYRETARLLGTAGFEATAAFHRDSMQHRFLRGGDVVDVLVADHAAPSALTARAVSKAVRAPGGTRALQNTVDAIIRMQTTEAEISLPDEFGALVLKASAYVIDSRDRGRHLEDLATLLAAQHSTRNVIDRCNAASLETRKRVSTALHALRMRHQAALSPATRLALAEFELDLLGEGDRARERR